jgi:hypothetical protein
MSIAKDFDCDLTFSIPPFPSISTLSPAPITKQFWYASATLVIRMSTSQTNSNAIPNRSVPRTGRTALAITTPSTSSSVSAAVEPRPRHSVGGQEAEVTTFGDLDYATQKRIQRAINILSNHGLLMRYALENDVVSLILKQEGAAGRRRGGQSEEELLRIAR